MVDRGERRWRQQAGRTAVAAAAAAAVSVATEVAVLVARQGRKGLLLLVLLVIAAQMVRTAQAPPLLELLVRPSLAAPEEQRTA